MSILENMTWCLADNFGDRLGPWLYRKLAKRDLVYVQPQSDVPHYLTVGSILNWANSKSVVWGAGLASLKDDVPPAGRITAVRGPLSRMKALQSGNSCPQVYGDPGLVVPRVFKPIADRVPGRVGIISHYVDQFRARSWFNDRPDCFIINVFDPIEKVLNDIWSCEKIVTSSLHGLVMADAFGIPNAWVKMSASIGGDGTKYWDHLYSVGRASMDGPPAPQFDWSVEGVRIDLDKVRFEYGNPDYVRPAVDRLMESCPFRV